ncbi:TPA: dTDP-4-dehydrorhamnose 3,5-epimerase family protein, partial [Streptococcus agalactiae]|nr:dTDP-4-dehydrorhamnose 3,5-epimerase family protein [Streptococcus agalactiae]
HFQNKYPQGKLIYVIKGKIFDVVVDIRSGSKTFGEWFSIILTSDNKNMMYVPEGFAHGYLVLDDETIVSYKCTDFYNPDDEMGIIWDDPDIGINWPCLRSNNSCPVLSDGCTEILISKKDKQWRKLNDLIK